MTRPGRPRNDETHSALLRAALDLAFERGFGAVTAEAIAARAGASKATLYRRWPNRAAVIMEAYLVEVSPRIITPPRIRGLERIRLQMRALARLYRGRHGALLKSLLGAAQNDPELAEAFLERWIRPRREEVTAMLREAMELGELKPGTNIDAAIEALYGPIYYRLQISVGPMSDAVIDAAFRVVVEGIRA